MGKHLKANQDSQGLGKGCEGASQVWEVGEGFQQGGPHRDA